MVLPAHRRPASSLATMLTLVALGGVAPSLVGCTGQTRAPAAKQGTAIREDTMSSKPSGLPSADRGAPATVSPVEREGVRYEQNLGATVAEFGQVGGILTARDAASRAVLWSLKVYPNERRSGLEGDVQDVFFRSMAFDQQGKLVIENERGRRFAVDVKARTVAPLP
jgi:hypothetical protein